MSEVTRPPIVRGGVIFLPLAASEPGDSWPQHIELRRDNGESILGNVVWIEQVNPPAQRTWATEPSNLRVRKVHADDDTTRPGGRPHLVALAPTDGDGALRLDQQVVEPRWLEPAAKTTSNARALAVESRPDRPDPMSPFAHWRWMLLANQLGLAPPTTDRFSSIEAMIAQYYADLWLVGFSRLRQQNEVIADACLNALTRTVHTGDHDVAAWIVDTSMTSELLSLLLDSDSRHARRSQRIQQWLHDQSDITVWPESSFASHVQLVAMNASNEERILTSRWLRPADVGVASTLRPRSIETLTFEAPRVTESQQLIMLDHNPPVLQVRCDDEHERLTIPRYASTATPPGVFLRPLSPPLTLADVTLQQQSPMPADRATLVSIRRLNARWEIFVDCRRPADARMEQSPENRLRTLSGWRDVRGMESVAILIDQDEDFSQPESVLFVPEQGWHRALRGALDETLQVHRRSYDDRWLLRIVLPNHWLNVESGTQTYFGFVRAHGDNDAIETGPLTSAPWRQDPGRVSVDLSQWTDLPFESEE